MDKKGEMIKMMERNAKVWVHVGANVITPPFHLDLSV